MTIKVGDIVSSGDTLGVFQATVMVINKESGVGYAVRQMGDKFRGYNFHVDTGRHANSRSSKVFVKVRSAAK